MIDLSQRRPYRLSVLGSLVFGAAFAIGCGPARTDLPTIPLQATPQHASMFGQTDVQLAGDFHGLGSIESVTIDGIQALDVRATPSVLTVYLQGAPAPGFAHIVITGDSGAAANDTAFSYQPLSDTPLTWGAFGASLTQGFESAGVQAHGQVRSWDAQIARAAGVYLALPLVVDAFIPPLQPSAFVANCGASWNESAIAVDVLGTLVDPVTNAFDLRRARQDPTLPTRNFAVGGAKVSDILQPASGPSRIIERVVELPDGDPGSISQASSMSQIDRLEALDPDVAVSVDLLANDSDSAVVQPDDLHPEQMTSLATITSELTTLAMRLGALHGDYFIGNLLPIDGLPNVVFLRAKRIAAGEDTEQSFDAKLDQVRMMVRQYNAALVTAVAPYPNLHIVDAWSATETVLEQGLNVNGIQLTGEKFGGLLSLDFLHFSDTGYAFMANVFIEAIDRTKGWQIPEVNGADVLAQDPLSPANLLADGVHCPSLPPSPAPLGGLRQESSTVPFPLW